MWPKTTSDTKTFNKSCDMAMQRLKQIIEMQDKKKLCIKSFLDIGCGPARYLYSANKLFKEIQLTGVDTGQTILNKNKTREELKLIDFIEDNVLCEKIDKKY